MDKKKLIIIGVGIVVIIGLALFLLFRGNSSDNGEPATTQGQGFLSFLFPSSQNKTGEPYANPDINGQNTNNSDAGQYTSAGKLVQLTDQPISGATFNEDMMKVDYFEKSTGHLYEIDPSGQNKKQLTITTIPKIFEVDWSKDASGAVFRYLSEPEEGETTEPAYAFSATSFASSTTEGVFLPSNTVATAVSPEENKIFYLLEGNSSAAGIVSDFENKNQKEIFSYPISEFLVDWPSKNTVTLLTKPSAWVEGYFYKLNPQTGSLAKILGNIPGLTALYSPYGNRVIYSQNDNQGGITTKIYDLNKGTTIDSNYKTLPEKCMFSRTSEDVIYCAVPDDIPAGYYPDDWYKGNVQFSDKLWKINLADGSTRAILEDGDFDIINLFSNKTGDYILFQNKKDGTLWSLQLTD